MPTESAHVRKLVNGFGQTGKIVDGIHDTLNGFVGQRLKVRAPTHGPLEDRGGEGVLTQVHPQLLIMGWTRKRGYTARQSYQYVDVLTGMVELSQNSEALFAPLWTIHGADRLRYVKSAWSLKGATLPAAAKSGKLRPCAKRTLQDVAQLGGITVRNVGVVVESISTTETHAGPHVIGARFVADMTSNLQWLSASVLPPIGLVALPVILT